MLGEGSIVSGLILAAIAAFIIDREWLKASYFAGAGAALTFFGFMHGPAVGIAVTPGVAAAYAIVAGFLYACSRQAEIEALVRAKLSRPPVPAE